MKFLDSRHRDILEFLYDNQEYTTTLMDIGNAIGIDHPQKVLDKLDQLENRGYISKNPFWGYQVLKRYEDTNQLALPFFGFAQCGNAGKNILEEYPRKKLPIEKNLINTAEMDQYFITRAKGDSMEPFIQSGDFALIHVQSSFDTGDKVLVVHNNQPKIKKIHTVNGQKVLQSYNPNHKDLILEEYDDINIVWVVKKIFPKDTFTV